MSSVIILDGKKLSEDILATQHYNPIGYRKPTLVIITVGENDASKVYVRNKLKACEQCDIDVIHTVFDAETPRTTLEQYIEECNLSRSIDGIIIQQPVPKHLKGLEQLVLPRKDVDGFTKHNLGNTLVSSIDELCACTPKGIMVLLHMYGIDLTGKHAVILGRSQIVGKPLIGLLLEQNATVTSCNSYTQDIKGILANADIIISAIGKPKYVTEDIITDKTTVIIDVGINRDNNGKLCGDCDYENIVKYWNSLNDNVERYITPVPKGVGPMTVATLLQNVNIAYHKNMVDELLRSEK